MRRLFLISGAVALGFILLSVGFSRAASSADRVQEATVLGKDRSAQAGKVPTDTRAVSIESKMTKEESPAGLKSETPGMRKEAKMEKPKMAEPERQKPDQTKSGGNMNLLWILLFAAVIAVAH